MARVKAENALLPVYRKELRKVLLENLQMNAEEKKKNYITVNYETKRKQHTRKIKLGKVRAVKLAVSSD